MTRETTRRQFVVAAGTVGTVLIAGCSGSGGTGSDGSTTQPEPDAGVSDDEIAGGGGDDDGTDDGETMDSTPVDPMAASRVAVDRFSEAAGTLMVRTAENDLPDPDEAIDFDEVPFVTRGFGPNGETVQYYNFDVQSTRPAPIYVLFREGTNTPVDGQLNVVDVLPGEEGYNDFWHVHRVTVPTDYEANTVTSLRNIEDAGYAVEATDTLVNCPVVPHGSTASMRFGDGAASLVEGWYRGQIVSYFEFTEAALSPTNGTVPVSPIYVSFTVNPDEDGGGPSSGFLTESGTDQTHNVLATLPGDDGYSPLWLVNVYDNADFDAVSDLDSATAAEILAPGAATVNCPVVSEG